MEMRNELGVASGFVQSSCSERWLWLQTLIFLLLREGIIPPCSIPVLCCLSFPSLPTVEAYEGIKHLRAALAAQKLCFSKSCLLESCCVKHGRKMLPFPCPGNCEDCESSFPCLVFPDLCTLLCTNSKDQAEAVGELSDEEVFSGYKSCHI